jgi:hypothetical protein
MVSPTGGDGLAQFLTWTTPAAKRIMGEGRGKREKVKRGRGARNWKSKELLTNWLRRAGWRHYRTDADEIARQVAQWITQSC